MKNILFLLAFLPFMSISQLIHDDAWMHSYVVVKNSWNPIERSIEIRTCLRSEETPTMTASGEGYYELYSGLDSDLVDYTLLINGSSIDYNGFGYTILSPDEAVYNISFTATHDGFPDYSFDADFLVNRASPTVTYNQTPNNTVFELPATSLRTHKGDGGTCDGYIYLNLSGGYTSLSNPYYLEWSDGSSYLNDFVANICGPTSIGYKWRDDWNGCSILFCDPTLSENCEEPTCDGFFCDNVDIDGYSCETEITSHDPSLYYFYDPCFDIINVAFQMYGSENLLPLMSNIAVDGGFFDGENTISYDGSWSTSVVTSGSMSHPDGTIVACSQDNRNKLSWTQMIPYFSLENQICAGDNEFVLPSVSDNDIMGYWWPDLNTSQTTTYTFIPYDFCIEETYFTLYVVDNPFVEIELIEGSLAATSGLASYMWYLNGEVLNDATTSSITPVTSGIYSVVVQNSAGCTSETSFEYTAVVEPENSEAWIHTYIKVKNNWNQDNRSIEIRTCLRNNDTPVVTGTGEGYYELYPGLDSDLVNYTLLIDGSPVSYDGNRFVLNTPSEGIHNITFTATHAGFPDYSFNADFLVDFVQPTVVYNEVPTASIFQLPATLLRTHKGSGGMCDGRIDLNLAGGYTSTSNPYNIQWSTMSNYTHDYLHNICTPSTVRYEWRDNWWGCQSTYCDPSLAVNCTENTECDGFFCDELLIENYRCEAITYLDHLNIFDACERIYIGFGEGVSDNVDLISGFASIEVFNSQYYLDGTIAYNGNTSAVVYVTAEMHHPDGSDVYCFTNDFLINWIQPIPEFSIDDIICHNDNQLTLPNVSDDDYLGYWTPTLNTTQTTTYTFVSSELCAGNTVLTIEVVDTPVVDVTLSEGYLIATEGFVSYEWYLNGVLLSGVNLPVITPVTNGQYLVVVQNNNGCIGEATITYNSVGIEENDVNKFNIYPNPSSGNITIDFEDASLRELSIYDNTGRLVYSNSISMQKTILDLTDLSNGSYQVIIRQDSSLYRSVVNIVK
jgi:hypothetical protein